jgi:hypothetical protein
MRPTLVINPVDDRSFSALADAAVDGGVSTAEGLQAVLRDRYPRAVVRARSLTGERILIWYVYREGRWIRSGRRPGMSDEV